MSDRRNCSRATVFPCGAGAAQELARCTAARWIPLAAHVSQTGLGRIAQSTNPKPLALMA